MFVITACAWQAAADGLLLICYVRVAHTLSHNEIACETVPCSLCYISREA